MKFLVPLALALTMAGGAAVAQTATDPHGANNAAVKPTHRVNEAAPTQGHNSFTMGQAREHIEKAGFTKVTGLAKTRDGVWRGHAMKGGKRTAVSMDFKGDVTTQ